MVDGDVKFRGMRAC